MDSFGHLVVQQRKPLEKRGALTYFADTILPGVGNFQIHLMPLDSVECRLPTAELHPP
jgi:hypothetical protein